MSASPTAQQLFGDSPWVTDPAPGGTGPVGESFIYDIHGFATPSTAAIVAQIVEAGLGLAPGSVIVVEANDITPYGPYKQNQPNQMVKLPDGTLHNAGLIAKEFASWQSIEPINAELSQEFGAPFVYKPVTMAPVTGMKPSNGLMVARIGGTAMQMDGTTWKRLT
jgi:hypothetical protein